AAALGALVSAGGLYAATQSPWRSSIAAWLGAPDPSSHAKIRLEPWPIRTTMTPRRARANWAQRDPDFAAGRKARVSEDWNASIAALKLASLREPDNADIENYIGYAYRRLRQFGPAMHHYQRALALNRRHRSAHEHLGELYLVLGEPAKAEHELVTLEDICLIPGVETDDIKRASAVYKALAMR